MEEACVGTQQIAEMKLKTPTEFGTDRNKRGEDSNKPAEDSDKGPEVLCDKV
jgi:hypothetical protein